jgi:tRNA(His) 5'-end guanylyltransferase
MQEPNEEAEAPIPTVVASMIQSESIITQWRVASDQREMVSRDCGTVAYPEEEATH